MKAIRLRNKKNVCFVPYSNCWQGRDYIVQSAKKQHGKGLAYAQETFVDIDEKFIRDGVIEFGVLVPRLDHLLK